MRKKLLSFFALLWLMVSSAWAAEVIYTSNDIGKLIGSDGNVYAAANDVPSGVTVSGMIAYINTSDHWAWSSVLLTSITMVRKGQRNPPKARLWLPVAVTIGPVL